MVKIISQFSAKRASRKLIDRRLADLNDQFTAMNRSLSEKKEIFAEMIKKDPKNIKRQEIAVEELQNMIDQFNPSVAVYSGWNVSSPPTIDEKIKSLEKDKDEKSKNDDEK